MTLDRFEEAWRADKSSAGTEEVTRALRQIEREGRFQTVLQYSCAAITLGMTTVIMAKFYNRNPPGFLLHLAVGIANVSVLRILFHRRMERRRRLQSLFLSVSDAATTALQDTCEQIKQLKTLAGIACAIVTLLPFAVYPLYLSGKMDLKSVAGFSVLTGAVLLVNAIGWGLHFRRSLRPRRERLEAFIATLGESQ